MTPTDNLTTLRRMAARHKKLREQLDTLEGERDDEIRALVEAKVPVTAIAEAAGLKPPRIYQIRDGRR